MTISRGLIEAPLAPAELTARWRALCANPTFEDFAGKLELTEWGEILATLIGKSHGIAAMRMGEALRKALAYVRAGAREAWLAYPESKRVEIYGAAGRLDRTSFAIDPDLLFRRPRGRRQPIAWRPCS